jgi:hypothetical protein
MYGDTCFKCGGNGKQYASKKVEKAAIAYSTAVRHLRRAIAQDLAVGDIVAADLGSEKGAAGRATVTAVETTDEACGWSLKPEEKVTAWRVVVTLDNGLTKRINGNQIVRRFGNVDITPYLEMCV